MAKYLFFVLILSSLTSLLAAPENTKTPYRLTTNRIFTGNHSSYKDELLERADQLKLYDDPYWKILLHYKPSLFHKNLSKADSPLFFFASKGETDPRAEMLATIDAFFYQDRESDIQALRENENFHPICRYPARFHWLGEKLNFQPEKMPAPRCTHIEGMLEKIKVNSISVVFASYYMNAPASMFGHTLLKLHDEQNKSSDLLDYALNFAASTGDMNVLAYSLRGLFGGLPGYYSLTPYHAKVKEYNDMESRDMWEYELKLSDSEIHNLILHAWELDNTFFDYYYLTENCSYQLLALLEAGRPDVQLSKQFDHGWVLPSETIKYIASRKNYVTKKRYRASVQSELQIRFEALSSVQRRLFFILLNHRGDESDAEFQKLSDIQKADLLDATLTAMRFRNAKQQNNNRDAYRKLLQTRTVLPEGTKFDFKKPNTESVESGHEIRSLRIGAGSDSNSPFIQFTYRPLYHDMMNREDGFARNSEFLFMNTSLRYYRDDGWRLQRMNLLKIASFAPYDRFTKSYSYSFNLSAETEYQKRKIKPAQRVEMQRYLYQTFHLEEKSDLDQYIFIKNVFEELKHHEYDEAKLYTRLWAYEFSKLLSDLPSSSLMQSSLPYPVTDLYLYQTSKKFTDDTLRLKRVDRLHALNFDLLGGVSSGSVWVQSRSPYLISFLTGVKAQDSALFHSGARIASSSLLSVMLDRQYFKMQIGGNYLAWNGASPEARGFLNMRLTTDANFEIRIESQAGRLNSDALLEAAYHF